ncbi:MAG: polysaccharide biosynthesis protein [Promethearchaeota archaeon]
MFENKIILITGGTGTVGEALIERLLNSFNPKIIRIFSRDETKQFNLAKRFENHKEKLRFFIGDIRDKERLTRAVRNVDVIFHLAALKHVLACEYNPFESIKTNILGLQNLIEVCIDQGVKKVVFTSTDKAATPCNVMGVTKLLGEKLITTANYYKGSTYPIFYSIRFGNVLGSRGSLIPLIENRIKNDLPIMLTHNEMTRYVITIDQAINFIFKTIEIAQGGEVFILKMDAIKIIDLIEVMIEYYAEIYKKKSDRIQIREIGLFAGEKLYEELFSIEESQRTYEIDDMYIILPQITEVSTAIDINKYPNIKKFDFKDPFNSKDSPLLSKEEIKELLDKFNRA